MTLGFVGLGTMGQPMATNLARSGTDLVVWNRSPGRAEPVQAAGAKLAGSAAEVFEQAGTVILMLADAASVDAVLATVDPRDRTVVHMGTVAPEDSVRFDAYVRSRGGSYVEAPVSGSRRPAEEAALVAMLAGEPDLVERVRPMLAPMCRQTFYCGPVGHGLSMKLATNFLLVSTMTAVTEAFHVASRRGLDLDLLRDILDSGQMSSPISRVKTAKLAAGDYERQAGLADVLKNTDLALDAAHAAGASTALLDASRDLLAEAVDLGLGEKDAIAVIRAMEARG